MIEYIALFLSIPLGILFAKLTKDEKPIYQKYFPVFMKILLILIAIFIFHDKHITLTLTFILLTIFIWNEE